MVKCQLVSFGKLLKKRVRALAFLRDYQKRKQAGICVRNRTAENTRGAFVMAVMRARLSGCGAQTLQMCPAKGGYAGGRWWTKRPPRALRNYQQIQFRQPFAYRLSIFRPRYTNPIQWAILPKQYTSPAILCARTGFYRNIFSRV